MRAGVLDHGYVQLIETWGSDERIIEAARMSTGKGFLGWGPTISDEPCENCRGRGVTDDRGHPLVGQPFFNTMTCPTCQGTRKSPKPGDEKLLRYLWEHKHHTPFEMAGMTIEVQAPIFIFREWHRHRVPFSYNEASARYAPLPNFNYIPTVERLMADGGHLTKQAAATKGKQLKRENAQFWIEKLEETYEQIQRIYEEGLAFGVPKELARVVLPVGRYSKMRASANIRGWLNFLTLRMASNAQWEMQQYANAVGSFVKTSFPRTWDLFTEGQSTNG